MLMSLRSSRRSPWQVHQQVPGGADGGLADAGHRGTGKGRESELPENTMASFVRALQLGASAIECDVHMNADGELVVIHDWKVDRTSTGTGWVSNMTTEEMEGQDFGAKHPSADLGEEQGDTGLVKLEDLLRFGNVVVGSCSFFPSKLLQ